MAIRVRSITTEESQILDRWQRGDEIVRYRRARILKLSEVDWRCPAIAEVLALNGLRFGMAIERDDVGDLWIVEEAELSTAGGEVGDEA